MQKSSLRLSLWFYIILLIAILNLFFLSANVIFLKDSTSSNLWMLFSISIAGLFSGLISHNKKISSLLGTIYSLVLFLVFFLGIKYLQIGLMGRLASTLPHNIPLVLMAGSVWILQFFLAWIIRSPFDKLYNLLAAESRFTDNETYATFIRETLGGKGHKNFASRSAAGLANIAILLLIFTFFSLSIAPQMKVLITIFIVLFGMAALGFYLICYQSEQLLDWKLSGLSIPEKLSLNWNRLILLLLGLSLAASLSIPWYFRVFNLQSLNQGLEDKLSGINITIAPDEEGVHYQKSTNIVNNQTNISAMYVISSINIKTWDNVIEDKNTVVSNIMKLELQLTSPSLTRQVFSIDKFGPDTMNSDDLNQEDSLLVLSSNRVLAHIQEKGQLSFSMVVEKKTATTVIEIPADETARAQVRVQVIQIILWSLLGLGALYFVLGLIGGVLLLKYRYTRRTPLVSFLIRRYERIKGLINALFFFFRLMGRFFLAVFGLRKVKDKNKEDLANPVAQQLYSLFKQKEGMSDEKKEEVLTIIREFVRLIDVASRLIVPYRYFYGPREYMDKVCGFQPDLRKILDKIVELFNESRYSLHILGESKLKNFSGAVKFAIDEMNKLDVGVKSMAERAEDDNQKK